MEKRRGGGGGGRNERRGVEAERVETGRGLERLVH